VQILEHSVQATVKAIKKKREVGLHDKDSLLGMGGKRGTRENPVLCMLPNFCPKASPAQRLTGWNAREGKRSVVDFPRGAASCTIVLAAVPVVMG